MSVLQSMAYPFLACLVLTGIHVYLGIHVIARKVIFVDLALAQIAAFGAVWGALLGWDLHDDPWQIKAFSLALTFLGAAVFALTRTRHERVPQEAIIGISYAVALAATILASTHLAHGAEEVQNLQAGSILWVRGETIAWTAALYLGIGLFHFVFRRPLLAISEDPAAAEAAGIRVRLWDFLFYVSFGFVVTSSVSIAGVLLVFCYLVIPAVIGVLFAHSIGTRLALGWTVGTLVSLAGIGISYYGDLPSGPTIVVTFGVFLIGAGALYHLRHARRRDAAALRLGAGLTLVAAIATASPLLRKRQELELAHVLATGLTAERLLALAQVAADPARFDEIRPLVPALLAGADTEVRLRLLDLLAEQDRRDLLPEILPLLTAPNDYLRERALRTVRRLGAGASVAAILAAAEVEADDYLRVEMAETVLEENEPGGVGILLAVMETAEAAQARKEAHAGVLAHVPGIDLPYDPAAAAAVRAEQVGRIRTWWEEKGRPLQPGPPHHWDD